MRFASRFIFVYIVGFSFLYGGYNVHRQSGCRASRWDIVKPNVCVADRIFLGLSFVFLLSYNFWRSAIRLGGSGSNTLMMKPKKNKLWTVVLDGYLSQGSRFLGTFNEELIKNKISKLRYRKEELH